MIYCNFLPASCQAPEAAYFPLSWAEHLVPSKPLKKILKPLSPLCLSLNTVYYQANQTLENLK